METPTPVGIPVGPFCSRTQKAVDLAYEAARNYGDSALDSTI